MVGKVVVREVVIVKKTRHLLITDEGDHGGRRDHHRHARKTERPDRCRMRQSRVRHVPGP